MKLKTIDLCAGIGGIRRGFELAGGYRNIASAEIDEMACKTYEHLFHEDPRNDVTNEKFKKHLQTLHYDVLMAGFPCQAFSSVGLQHGFEDKTKGTIFFDIAKIIKMTRPKVVFLENVQNLLSHDKQATFKTIVDTLDRQLDYHIVGVTHDKDGIPQYKRSAFLRNSRDFGVPQNRPRVYIVAFSRAYFGQHISLLPEEAPTKRSRTPVFKSLADVLDKKVDSRFFLSSGYLDTLEKHIVTQHKKGYGFGYCIVNAPEIETPIANTLLATGGSGRERNLIYDPINGASCAGTSIKGKSVADAYSGWIDTLKEKQQELSACYKAAAESNIAGCLKARNRMLAGLKVLNDDSVAWTAFSLANRAMFMQRVHLKLQSDMADIDRYPGDEDLTKLLETLDYGEPRSITGDNYAWRLFQIAFLLMSIESVTNDTACDRDVVDLIWFPTGGGKTEAYLTTSVKYRAEEYEALSGEVSMSTDDYGDFLREGTEISNYAIPFIKSISLIHKVREVQALVGFSRLKPVDANMGESSSEYVVPVKQQDTNWYPAYEVRGEGIFIEFDENAISEWQKDNPEIQHRVDVLNENYRKSFIGQSKPRKVTAKFLLLHTISHTLIKQLSFECGYSIASLKERLYCSEISEGKQMSGIFIYTASGDSEGTMGGLVRQGCADTFPGIFKKAMEEAMTCSNDPVCSLSMGQGRDSLNLSACYSCCLIPETSCEEFNIFLDRGTIVGTYENREMGFYSRQLYGTASWKDNSISKVTTDVSLKSSVHVIVTDYGTDLRDSVYAEIWNSLRTWAVDTKEKVLLSELESNSDLFSQKEKPYRDCMFQVGGNEEMQKCDLFWKESQVALFTSDNEECYAAAKNSDIRCIYCADDTVTVRKILDVLKEQ